MKPTRRLLLKKQTVFYRSFRTCKPKILKRNHSKWYRMGTSCLRTPRASLLIILKTIKQVTRVLQKSIIVLRSTKIVNHKTVNRTLLNSGSPKKRKGSQFRIPRRSPKKMIRIIKISRRIRELGKSLNRGIRVLSRKLRAGGCISLAIILMARHNRTSQGSRI